jgi:hypothetical protein
MANQNLERVLQIVDPAKRDFLKKMIIGTAFVVPTVASFAVADLAYGQVGSPGTTTTLTLTTTIFTTTITRNGDI